MRAQLARCVIDRAAPLTAGTFAAKPQRVRARMVPSSWPCAGTEDLAQVAKLQWSTNVLGSNPSAPYAPAGTPRTAFAREKLRQVRALDPFQSRAALPARAGGSCVVQNC